MGLTRKWSKKYCTKMDLPIPEYNLDGTLDTMDYGAAPYESRAFVEQTTDEMDIWISMSSSTETGSDLLRFIITPFIKMCTDIDADYRKCPRTLACIPRHLFCDEMVNCPNSEVVSEESMCRFHHLRGGALNNVPVAFLVVFILLTFSSILLLIWKFKWDNSDKGKLVLKLKEEKIEKLFKVKRRKKSDDSGFKEASAPPNNNSFEDFFNSSKEQAENCTKVDCDDSFYNK